MNEIIIVSVNNQATQIPSQMTLSDAIIRWGFGETKIAVAINGEFVPRSTYQERIIQDGEKIDIVKPVGGG